MATTPSVCISPQSPQWPPLHPFAYRRLQTMPIGQNQSASYDNHNSPEYLQNLPPIPSLDKTSKHPVCQSHCHSSSTLNCSHRHSLASMHSSTLLLCNNCTANLDMPNYPVVHRHLCDLVFLR